MSVLFILLEQATGSKNYMSIIMLVLVIVIFYFFFIRPSSKRQKQQRQYQESLKKGDKIVTIGGIHATIVDQTDTTFLVETEGGNRMRIEKTAVNVEFSSKK